MNIPNVREIISLPILKRKICQWTIRQKDDKTEEIITKLSESLYPHELNKVKKALPGSEQE
jgi:hypothetical protein